MKRIAIAALIGLGACQAPDRVDNQIVTLRNGVTDPDCAEPSWGLALIINNGEAITPFRIRTDQKFVLTDVEWRALDASPENSPLLLIRAGGELVETFAIFAPHTLFGSTATGSEHLTAGVLIQVRSICTFVSKSPKVGGGTLDSVIQLHGFIERAS
jgi:hypothetical protein